MVYRLVLKLSTPHNQSHSVALYHGEYLTSRSSQQSGVLNLSTPRYATRKLMLPKVRLITERLPRDTETE